MQDKALFILIRQTLIAGLVARELPDVIVQRAFQPTQQGQSSARTVYFHKPFERPHGSPRSKTDYDGSNMVLRSLDMQIMESTFTFGATVTPDNANMMQLTANDLLKTVRAIVQSESFRQTLVNNGVGVLRVMQIIEPLTRNDRDQFRNEPSFDLIITHRDTYTVEVPGVDVFTADILPI